jgi:hypothetical protein
MATIRKSMVFCLAQRAMLALCLAIPTACSRPACRQWEIEEIVTQNPCFNGGRLILSPDSDYSHVELELIRNASGIRFYINLLFLHAMPWNVDHTRTCVTIQIENQDPWTVYPYLLEGGQRLLLPSNVADILVQHLLDNQSFTIQIGHNQTNVLSHNFLKVYRQLLDLSIDECLFPSSCS